MIRCASLPPTWPRTACWQPTRSSVVRCRQFSAPENRARTERENESWLGGELNRLDRETDIVTGTGETLHTVVRLDAVVLPSGRRYFLAQLRDVTADRQQERDLAASEARYRQLANSLPDTSVLLFDRDLRLIVAAGEALAASGYSSESLAGALLHDAFPSQGVELLDGPYRAALAGRSTDFMYTSPVVGRVFRTRVRPVLNPEGEVVGGLSVMEDVTADRTLVTQLEQIHKFGRFGGSTFDVRSGWEYDDALLGLWGIDETAQLSGLPMHLLPSDEQAATTYDWSTVLTTTGRYSLSYTINHGRTGELRHLQCVTNSVVDNAGVLMHVIASHVDVTDAVAATIRVELEQAAAAAERSRLLRQLGDMLATSRLGPEQLLRTIVEHAAGAIGEGAAIRILTPGHRAIERDVIAHPNESIRLRLAASLQRSARDPIPDSGILAEIVDKGRLLSDSRQGNWKPEFRQNFTDRVFDEAAHMMVAPVRHNGTVLGKLAVFRMDPDAPYLAGDGDVLQVLADGAGAAIAENRSWQEAERVRDRQLTTLRKQQAELLEKLEGMETRERTLLAEAIHDEPIQRIVAGILRLDHLSPRLDPVTSSEVNDVTEQLATTVDWLRDLIVVTLTAPDLSAGLGPALASLAHNIFTGTQTVFTVEGLDHVQLSARAKEATYRIFREGLGNVRKHAHAHHAVLRLKERGAFVVISLTDDGVGSASLNAGAGHLGMATMRARAEAEGAQLHVESVPGLGTVVTLTMPAHAVTSTPAPVGAVPAPIPANLHTPRTIVVCDDHQHVRDAVKLVLSTVSEFQVVGEAFDADTCLEQVRKSRPDILILDVSMPGGGPHLAKAMKRMNPGMHIIVFSAWQHEQTRSAMLAAGADQYLMKTGRLQPLVEALGQAAATTRHSGDRHDQPTPDPALQRKNLPSEVITN